MRKRAERQLEACEGTYPKSVSAGQLTQDRADTLIQEQKAIVMVIKTLAINEEKSRAFLRGLLTDKAEAEKHPAVQNVKQAFPEAEVTSVTDMETEAA